MSHDTGEGRPLTDLCDRCVRDPATCGECYSDCVLEECADEAERRFEAERDARD